MKRLSTIAAAALFALSFSAPPASAQGFMGQVMRARAHAEAQRTANQASVEQVGERNAAGVAQLGRGNSVRPATRRR